MTGMNANERKTQQLGMSYGTAAHRLRKMLMFKMAQELGMGVCIRCGLPIEDIADFTIDHIEPWLHVDPDLFWDLDNIGFAHKACNYREARRNPNHHPPPLPLGEQHRSAKLTEADALSIRQRYAAGEANGPTLAREYGVHHAQIYNVIHRHTWKNV